MAPPMENFPLPIELREEIYSYLLHLDTERDIAQESVYSKQFFRFDTAIFRVNKRIHEEAARCFGRIDPFVLIRVGSWEVMQHLEESGARVYAAEKVLYVPSVAYTIELSDSEINWWGHTSLMDDRQSILILESDVSKLWTVLRGGTFGMPSDCVHVISKPGDDLELAVSGESLPTPAVRIWAHDSKYVALNADRKQTFLASACDTLGDYFNLSFYGFDHEAGKPLIRTAPTIIWPLAFEWNKFDAVMSMKLEADGFIAAGNFEEARRILYYASSRGHDLVFWADPDGLSGQVGSRESAGLVWPAMSALQYDIELSMALLEFRRDGLSISYGPDASSIRPGLEHFLVIDQLCRYAGSSGGDALIRGIVRLEALPTSVEIRHDIACIRHILYTQIPENFAEAFKGVFSPHVFPFKIINTVPDQGRRLHGRPDGLVGWQDTIHLAQFTKEDKEAVVHFQKEHGLRVTNFEVDGPKGAEGSPDGKSQDQEENQD
ncbi:unnamed protein product [Zymoseptoria tritici ST99CH_1A5]|uniref:Uncharacterized protein n=4 Tax=Zymoseptoria tritici TaxID=1047171 RepID=F9X736_ZYMTI|nr:uncharacterized protein MYCGRDRAFT_92126 [Zymoseptoria tritici IPO323]SMQ49360.1 unnamed protein product [Zymoseptoria tritici ST99CH_3D7]SMR49189.1 unnamed protein product [Zymoseptoria tritici ST99CH_1E4]SMR50365.1 unnamed protein product [Zymoseptoria tritici ST99CH_3D1]SMY23056.1 unnamed protein product [Zymoseptoria tritici ST99CH_1A5]EGP89069.1 hypothetical protein MYCGRDRAFT_92126 [Zymoseptoria tritici IPO323]